MAKDVGSKLNDMIMTWGTLGIVIVIISIVMLKFKDVTGMTSELNNTIDTFVGALSEPKNWVSIVIIAVIGFAILSMFRSKSKSY